MLRRGNVPLTLSSTCNHLDNNRSYHIFVTFKKLSPKQWNRAQHNTRNMNKCYIRMFVCHLDSKKVYSTIRYEENYYTFIHIGCIFAMLYTLSLKIVIHYWRWCDERAYSHKQHLSRTFDKHIESHSNADSVTWITFFQKSVSISVITFVENCLRFWFHPYVVL